MTEGFALNSNDCIKSVFCVLQTFRAIKCFLGKLEKVSENPELASEIGLSVFRRLMFSVVIAIF